MRNKEIINFIVVGIFCFGVVIYALSKFVRFDEPPQDHKRELCNGCNECKDY